MYLLIRNLILDCSKMDALKEPKSLMVVEHDMIELTRVANHQHHKSIARERKSSLRRFSLP